jgi:hypothetical protein
MEGARSDSIFWSRAQGEEREDGLLAGVLLRRGLQRSSRAAEWNRLDRGSLDRSGHREDGRSDYCRMV